MSLPTEPPRAILFDWDNTLVDSWNAIHEALAATFTEFGLQPWTPDETRARVRLSLKDSFPALFGDRWEAARDFFYDHIRTHHLATLTPMAGAAGLLERLAGRGIYLGIVSNRAGALLRAEAGHLGWDRLFGALVGAGDAPSDKPDPAPVHLALAPSGLAVGPHVWFVGDTDVDADCAERSGCRPLLIGSHPAERFGHVHRVGDCDALDDLVTNLCDTI